ncbi:hypothetical protein [Micromonospora matsumotoense]|uniref:hypothetical protein n=1 Tax=Micromonospora matsumotoense TaxID=121616 RepID=UPI0033F67C04
MWREHRDGGAATLGAAPRRTSDRGRSPPGSWRSPSAFAPVLDALGVRSYATYAKGTRHVDVERVESMTLATRDGSMALYDVAVLKV